MGVIGAGVEGVVAVEGERGSEWYF